MMISRAGYEIRRWMHVLFVFATCLHSVFSQCSGTTLVFTATDTYQVFTSYNYPFGYGNDQDCMWRIEADNLTDAVRMEITDAGIEFHASCVYDYGQVFDGYNVSADSLGKFCGTDNPSYVSTGSYLTVTFKSDYSLYSKGFKARYKSGQRYPNSQTRYSIMALTEHPNLLDKEEDSTQLNMLAILGASIGSLVFVVVVVMLIYTYIQAKKAKELRRNPNLHRGMRLSRVEPFGYGGGWSYLDGPAPPAYGEIYSSPMSPPPQYCEVDPNPNPSAPLPGRREFMDDNQPNEYRNTSNTDAVSRERSDSNANTHFIVTRNIRGVVTQGNITTVSRTRTPNTGGATVNRSIQILSPASLRTAGNETMSNENIAGTNIPGQTESLPNAVVPLSTASSQGHVVPSNNLNADRIENVAHATPGQTIPADTVSTSAQNDMHISLSRTVTADGVDSLCQNMPEDHDDTCSTVSEMSLPPSPVQDMVHVS